MSLNIATIEYPGSNGHMEVKALCKATFNCEITTLWHKDAQIPKDTDLLILGGGTSFADTYRPGAIAALSPIAGGITRFSQSGGKILGVGNGFQILCLLKLLPGSLEANYPKGFYKKEINIIQSAQKIFNNEEKKHYNFSVLGTHSRYLCSKRELLTMNDNDQVAFKFCNKKGVVNKKENNNNSTEAICGVQNKEKNILGFIFRADRAYSKEKRDNNNGVLLLKSMFL